MTCKENEYNIFSPPDGLTCYQYAGDFAVGAGGYINNPNATADCQYCKWTVGDQYLSTVGVSYGQRWRNVGLECAFILFNVAFLFIGYYIFREAKWSLPKFGGKKGKKASEVEVEKVDESEV